MHLINQEINDKFVCQDFFSGSFLQSSIWQDFLHRQHRKNWSLSVVDSGQQIASCLLYQNTLPAGKSYLYAPKGPVFYNQSSTDDKKTALRLILSKARDICSETGKSEEIFFKLEPGENLKIKELIPASAVQPQYSWLLDLNIDEAQLLNNTHVKTRYNINLAQRREVKIVFSQAAEDINIFLNLNKKTAERNRIQTHPEEYYRTLWQTLINKSAGELAIAYYRDQAVAANILVYFGQAATYLHGASDYEQRQLMAPHLLQWRSILRAQENKYQVYDFWGIAPLDGSKPSWEGFSRFKRSFGGRLWTSAHAVDLVYENGWYKLYHLAAKIRRKLPFV